MESRPGSHSFTEIYETDLRRRDDELQQLREVVMQQSEMLAALMQRLDGRGPVDARGPVPVPGPGPGAPRGSTDPPPVEEVPPTVQLAPTERVVTPRAGGGLRGEVQLPPTEPLAMQRVGAGPLLPLSGTHVPVPATAVGRTPPPSPPWNEAATVSLGSGNLRGYGDGRDNPLGDGRDNPPGDAPALLPRDSPTSSKNWRKIEKVPALDSDERLLLAPAVKYSKWMQVLRMAVGRVGPDALQYFDWVNGEVTVRYERYLEENTAGRVKLKNMKFVIPENFQEIDDYLSPLIFEAVTRSVRDEVMSSGMPTSFPYILYEMSLEAGPGTKKEKTNLYDNLIKIDRANNIDDLLLKLRAWKTHLTRAVQLDMGLPQPNKMVDAVQALLDSVKISKDMDLDMQIHRRDNKINLKPTLEAIEGYYDVIVAGLREEEKGVVPKAKGLNVVDDKKKEWPTRDKGKGKGEKDKGKGKGKDEKKNNLCHFFSSGKGCVKGGLCTFEHPRTLGQCFRCGNKDHGVVDCKAPKKLEVPGGKGSKSPSLKKTVAEVPPPSVPDLQEVIRTAVMNVLKETVAMKMLHIEETDGSSGTLLQRALDELEAVSSEAVVTAPSVEVGRAVRNIRKETVKMKTMSVAGQNDALADSGASHLLRCLDELEEADGRTVTVQTALGNSTAIINDAGEVVVPAEQEVEPLLPLGKTIAILGMSLSWSAGQFELRDADGRLIDTYLKGDLPYITKKEFDLIRRQLAKKARMNGSMRELWNEAVLSVMKMKEKQSQEEHERCGHVPFRSSCATCQLTAGRDRPHRSGAASRPGQRPSISFDLSGPHPRSAGGGEVYAVVGVAFVPKQRDDGEVEEEQSVTSSSSSSSSSTSAAVEDKVEELAPLSPAETIQLAVEQEKLKVEEIKLGYSSVVYVEFVTKKTSEQVLLAVQSIVAQARHETGADFSRIHTDRGSEFTNETMRRWTIGSSHPLFHTTCGVGDKSANARAERWIGMLKMTARAMLWSAGLAPKYWKFAMSQAAVIHRARALEKPLPAWVPRFGSNVVGQFVNEESRKSWMCRGVLGRFLGNDCRVSHGAVVLHPSGHMETMTTIRPVEGQPPTAVEKHVKDWRQVRSPEGKEVWLNIVTGDMKDECPVDDVVGEVAEQVAVEDKKAEPVVEKEHECRACQGAHVPHARDATCRLDPLEHVPCRACCGGHVRHTYVRGCRKFEEVGAAVVVKQMQFSSEDYVIGEDVEALRELDLPPSMILTTAREVVKTMGLERQRWIDAITEELSKLEAQGLRHATVDEIRTAKALPMKGVLGMKPRKDSVEEKCRLVICSNKEAPDGSFTKSLTVDTTTLRTVVAIGGLEDYWFGSVDYKAAFLNAPVVGSRVQVVRLPRFLVTLGIISEAEQYRVVTHAVYGRRESPREWGIVRDDGMRGMKILYNGDTIRLVQSECDPCLWRLKSSSGTIGLATTHVDDVLVGAESRQLRELVLEGLGKLWKVSSTERLEHEAGAKMKYCGAMLSYVDRKIAGESRRFLKMDQADYVIAMLVKLGMDKCNAAPTPGVVGEEDPDWEDIRWSVDPSKDEVALAMARVGELTWVATHTRIDISRALSKAAEVITTAPDVCLRRCHRILRYLRGTSEYGLHQMVRMIDSLETKLDEGLRERLERDGADWVGQDVEDSYKIHLRCYGDASYAPNGGKSVGGVAIYVGMMPISWRSQKIKMSCESSAEAELYTQTDTSVMGMGIAELIEEGMAMKVFHSQRCDNTAAICQIAGSQSWRSRHWSTRAAAIRDRIRKRRIVLGHISGKSHPGDGLTKALTQSAHRDSVHMWGMDWTDQEGIYTASDYVPLKMSKEGQIIVPPEWLEEEEVNLKSFQWQDVLVRTAMSTAGQVLERQLALAECPPCPPPPAVDEGDGSSFVAGAVMGALATMVAVAVRDFLMMPRPPQVRDEGMQSQDTYDRHGQRFRYLGSVAVNRYDEQSEIYEGQMPLSRSDKCCRRRR